MPNLAELKQTDCFEDLGTIFLPNYCLWQRNFKNLIPMRH
jgi:hypothetical protein